MPESAGEGEGEGERPDPKASGRCRVGVNHAQGSCFAMGGSLRCDWKLFSPERVSPISWRNATALLIFWAKTLLHTGILRVDGDSDLPGVQLIFQGQQVTHLMGFGMQFVRQLR